MEAEKLVKAAKYGNPLPEDATLAQSLFYHNIRALFYEFKVKMIDANDARNEKNRLVQQYGVQRLMERCNEVSYKRIRKYQTIASDAEKNGCPICKKITRILDGREG